jgi:hypothetical protein
MLGFYTIIVNRRDGCSYAGSSLHVLSFRVESRFNESADVVSGAA